MTTQTLLTRHEWAVAVDTVLGSLWEAQDAAYTRRASLRESCHYGLEERATYRSRYVKAWPTTDAEAERLYREKVAAGQVKSWDMPAAQRLLANLDEIEAHIAALKEITEEFEAEYTGWERFFLVTNSGGHIHSSMGCGTCYPTTRFAWLPELSGLTEASAVAAHGTILCSVCFPTAPVEWTVGKTKPAGCAGSGQYVEALTNAQGRTFHRYGKCPTCGESIARNQTGVLRKHGPKKVS